MAGESDTDVLRLTAKIISAHVGNNQVTVDALPELIQSVHRSLVTAGTAEPAPAPAPPTPAVPIRKSVFPDHIVCLEDGKKLKMLKRYLQTSYGMTPEQYRRKWGLPADYPMVAPNYASHRSSLAKQAGLGRKPASSAPEQTKLPEEIAEPDLPVEPLVTKGRARRARGSKG
jgi:predicted transcriptional regulator